MTYTANDIAAVNRLLISVIEGEGQALDLIHAAAHVIPFTAAFCVINRSDQPPLRLADTYPDGPAKQAVQLYVSSTYLLNPIYNAFLEGLETDVYCMSELAPDNWGSGVPEHLINTGEEIGYLTPGWPTGLQELVLAVNIPGGALGEISFARPTADGGFGVNETEALRPFLPLFKAAFRQIWHNHSTTTTAPHRVLENFARDTLSPREADVVHMILKGHSSLSISLAFDIALSTVKTHRKNAYAKLGISTQQQLFNAFLVWQKSSVK